MWGTITPNAVLSGEEQWRSLWFPFPFGVSERCKKLDIWASGKHGNTTEKLSDEWQERNARLFLNDYEALILGHCQTKWPRAASEAWPTMAAEMADQKQRHLTGPPAGAFTYNADGPAEDAPEAHKIKNQQMTKALLFYSSEILVPELCGRLLRHKLHMEARSETMTWSKAKEIFTQFMEKQDARLQLYGLVVRESDWCALYLKGTKPEVHRRRKGC